MADEGLDGIAHRLSQALHESLAVAAIVILNAHRRLPLVLADVERHAELRDVELQILHVQFPSSALIALEHAHLIGKHDFGRQVVVGCDLGEGIVLVAQRLVEVLAGGLQEVHHTLLANEAAHCQRVDKHAHGVADAQVGAPVADGTEADALLVGEAGQRVEGGSQRDVGRREVVLPAKGLYLLEVKGCHGLADGSLLLGIGQVGSHFGDTFALAELAVEEVAGFPVVGSTLGCFLLGHKGGKGEVFGLDGLAIHERAKLVEEDVERTAVDDQVVNVGQQADMLLGGDDFEAVERTLFQVERAHELAFVIGELRFGHRVSRDDGLLFRLADLHDVAAFASEVDGEFRMHPHQRLQRLSQSFGVGILREDEQRWNVVNRADGLLHAVDVDTHLGIRKRNADRLVRTTLRTIVLHSFDSLNSLNSFSQHLLEDFVLDALQRASLRQRLRVEGYAETLVDLNGQLDGSD